MTTLRLLAPIALLAFSGTALAADTYKVDAVHSGVMFKAHHFSAGYTWGRFLDITGTFEVEESVPTAMEITVKAESVDTGSEKRDKHLRNDDFLGAEAHPEISFKAKSVAAAGEGTWNVTGDLTLHGVTREITAELRHTGEGKDPWGGYRLGLDTSFTISQKDFGMSYDGVGDEVTLHVSLEGKKK